MLLVAHRTPASRAACERAAAAGAQVFEADVQVDDRDQIVVSHYFPIGRGGLLQRDNWRIRWHTRATRDPRLADVLAVVPEQCLTLLDLKGRVPDRRARLVAALIDAVPNRDRIRVCSAHPDELDELRAAGFRTWRTAGNPHELATVLAESRLPDDAVTIRHSFLTRELVERLHERTPSIVAWTVNDLARARELREMGIDGVTTDRTAILRALSSVSN